MDTAIIGTELGESHTTDLASRKLLCAIVELAAADCQRGDRQAREWFTSGPFQSYCDMLSLSADEIRGHVLSQPVVLSGKGQGYGRAALGIRKCTACGQGYQARQQKQKACSRPCSAALRKAREQQQEPTYVSWQGGTEAAASTY